MANDAKLGLVLGVGIVIVIALVFFRADPIAAKVPAAGARPAIVQPRATAAVDLAASKS